jgi:cytochrome c5
MSYRYSLSVAMVLAASFASAMAAPQNNAAPQAPEAAPQAKAQGTAPAGKKQAPAAQASVHEDDGQRVFDQNCSRCHNAPDGFSSRISGTVVRHMRVRAGLSQHDEEELLRFLNP